MTAEPGRRCAECGGPLAADQRYCLNCGARAGARSSQLGAVQARVRSGFAAPTPGAPAAPRQGGGPTLPSRKVSALLVGTFLGFGVLIGLSAGSRVQSTLAASARHLKVVVPSTNGAPTAAAEEESEAAGEAESEPPETTEASTPAAASSTHTAASTQAPSSSQSGGSETGSQPGEAGGEAGGSRESGGSAGLPKKLKHVFVIVLSEEPYASVFGPSSAAGYLSHTLERRGALLLDYQAVAHEQLANEIAIVSGQGPTVQTAANCPTFTDIAASGAGAEEQVLGEGCVYPAATATLPGQLAAKHLRWRAYVQGIDEAGAAAGPCAHPPLGQPDPSSAAAGAGPYATFRNPFVYFHSLIDSPACAADDVGLAALRTDLTSAARTPSLAYVVPDRCHDGNPVPCRAGAPAGMAPADAFLRTVVPEIMRSAAYKQGGLIAITVDEAPSSGEMADSSSCCGQPSFPNLAATQPATGLAPRGGGTVGALLLSPFIKGPKTSQAKYNHFSLLRTIEDVFGLGHLGYAALPAVKSFEASLFSASSP